MNVMGSALCAARRESPRTRKVMGSLPSAGCRYHKVRRALRPVLGIGLAVSTSDPARHTLAIAKLTEVWGPTLPLDMPEVVGCHLRSEERRVGIEWSMRRSSGPLH